MGSTTTAPPPLTAHLTTEAHSGPAHTPPKGIHLGRERVNWNHKVWERIDRAVQHEFHRTRVAGKFLPHHRVDPHVTTVPADSVLAYLGGPAMGAVVGPAAVVALAGNTPLLNIDEGATTRLIETWVEFSMTPQQVEQENQLQEGHPEHHDAHEGHPDHPEHGQHEAHPSHHQHHGFSTAVTLAARAAIVLSEFEDTVLFQGQIAFTAAPSPLGSPLFQNSWVLNRGVPSDSGLLCVSPGGLPNTQVIQVPQTGAPGAAVTYLQQTLSVIDDAYSILQAMGHYGPYACVLHYYPYADSYAPLPNTLILPADRINPLMREGYFGTGTIPGTPAPVNPAVPVNTIPNPNYPNTQSMGLVVSVGGNTMDMVIGQDPVTAFVQQDPNGNFRFRVFERFALRLKDTSAVVRLEFQ